MSQNTSALLQQALAFHQQGRLSEAQALYRQTLAAQPANFDALHYLGILAVQTGNFVEAANLLSQAVAANPKQPQAHFHRGVALDALQQHNAAIESYDDAIRLMPAYGEAHANRGNALVALQRLEDALISYNQAVQFLPTHAETYHNRGNVLKGLGRYDAAIADFDKAVALKPDYADAHFSRAATLWRMAKHEAAVTAFDQVIRLKPSHADAHYNRGLSLSILGRDQDAIAAFSVAAHLNPNDPDIFNDRGNSYSNLKQFDAALADYEKAIALKPDFAAAHHNRGKVLNDLKRHDEALASYDAAIRLDPKMPFIYGSRLRVKMTVADWRSLDTDIADVKRRIEAGEKAVLPFALLTMKDSPALQFKGASIWAKWRAVKSNLGPIARRDGGKRIRIGYFSADYYRHAMMALMAGLFEQHDRDAFEWIGFSLGQDTEDDVRKRVSAAFDQFIDVRGKSDMSIAALARFMNVDIAVDLNGDTQNARTGIFAHRAAPIQVNYLGYPGTMGADYMDYVIGDAIVTPAHLRPDFAEKIVTMPHSYQVNDRQRQIADKRFSRAELGLPEDGFVFCCFNNTFKILPETFDIWMHILKRVPGSVAWLFEDSATASANLRREAARRGIDENRLIFAKRMLPEDHLARHRAADLLLDTLPYNAHTTASDALWVGLPVLTRMGQSMAGRVAASLLTAVGLPELITTTAQEYEDLAVTLATDPTRLQQIKDKLARNRLTTPLFDTTLFARDIERAYKLMVERYRAGLPPDHISVPPS